MRVLALMKYGRRAAGTRQRLMIYEPYLKAHGIEIDMTFLLDDDYIARLAQVRRPDGLAVAVSYGRRLWQVLHASRYDLIWVYYETFPWLPGMFEGLVGLAGKPVIYDFDDAVFHAYDSNASATVRAVLGKKLVPLLARADACSCGNAYLRAYAERYCANSVVIPTVVDTSRYRPADGAKKNDGPLVVGWIGSPSNWRHVSNLLPALLPALARRGARLRVVGAGPRARGIAGVEAIEWTEDKEIAEVQGMDIGIMPLSDEPFARGKCGFKLVQYMACGLPVIASPVGVNREIVEDGENGFLADGPDQWAERLDRLLIDEDLRRRMGARGRERVVERFSLASQEPRLLALIHSAVERRAAPAAQVYAA